jgi:hypothetical protein
LLLEVVETEELRRLSGVRGDRGRSRGGALSTSGVSSRREELSRTKLGVSTPTSRRKKVPVEAQPQYVGVDLHRRRSLIVRKSTAGEVLETVRIDDDPLTLTGVLAAAGESPEVVLEATQG